VVDEGERAEYEAGDQGGLVQEGLASYGAYQKACELFGLVADDMTRLKDNPLCFRLVGQQVASADSVCANIEEGYGRRSRKEYAQFLIIARGSAQETRGRYGRVARWLPQDIVADRVARCNEIIAILTTSIRTLRGKGGAR
jgi:four helix bundle protein